MTKIITNMLLTGLLAFFAAGCARQNPGKIVARVGNRVITSREMDERIAKLPSYLQSMVLRNRRRFLEDLMVEELFYEEAIRQNLQKDKETQDIIKEAKKKIVIAKLIKKEVEDKIKTDDASVRRYYEEHQDEFKTPEMWRVSHILVATEEEAADILKGVNSSQLSFEDVARSKSLDATAKRGGDIGYFTKGQLLPEFEEACFKLDIGSPCQIVKTRFGYHVIKLTDKKPSQTEDFDKAKGVVEDKLKRAGRKELFNNLITRLKQKYNATIEETVQDVGEEKADGSADRGSSGQAQREGR